MPGVRSSLEARTYEDQTVFGHTKARTESRQFFLFGATHGRPRAKAVCCRKRVLAMRLIFLLSATLFLRHVRGFCSHTIASSPCQRRDGFRVSLEARKSPNDLDAEDAKIVEEVRLNVLENRRNMIRWTLRNAESLRNFRLKNGWVPELDENGQPVRSDGKTALTLTATVVAIGAVILRVGGRAALVSAVGLDFMNDENAELKQNLDQILTTAESMDTATKLALFTAAWTAVKVLCFDAAGVALALASGILFGGVFPGALASAGAATIGSTVAFTMAKLDTPVRKKALELLDENPPLRGIEKVVAEDGLKAILTLRLAPILPGIPIGMYNYIYGVTGVSLGQFMGGIFLGSLKPYLLDSYLGYFGKELIDGSSANASSMQDVILLVAVGASVMIGVFASQLAAETWDSVLEEIEADKQANASNATEVGEEIKGISRQMLGSELPAWAINLQVAIKEAELSVNNLIDEEIEARVWNYTKQEPPPAAIDPACRPDSPEIRLAHQGIDYGVGFCESMVLSPLLMQSFFRFADPLYNAADQEENRPKAEALQVRVDDELKSWESDMSARLNSLKSRVNQRLDELEKSAADTKSLPLD